MEFNLKGRLMGSCRVQVA